MKYIEALNEIPYFPRFPRIFLAGGITGCEDWQSKIKENLEDLDVILMNPRRKDFPIHDPNASLEQIKWEFKMFRRSTCISYWFSKETTQPIVLFELGAWSMFMKMRTNGVLPEKLIISIDENYPRKQDVLIQMKFLGILTEVCTLERHIDKLREYVNKWWKSEPYTDFYTPYFKEVEL